MKETINLKKKWIRFVLLALLILLAWMLDLSAQSDYKLAEQDSLALVAFYWATDGPNWTSNQDGFGFDDLSSEWQGTYDGGFNKWFDGPAKDWFGVRVEKRAIPNSVDSTYRVTWLWPVIGRRTDGQNQLKGYVPREVGLLTALEEFRVNGNDGFSWELIPDEIYHPTLEYFDTESAWFGGGLSDALRNCTSIRKLNVRYNYYDYVPNFDFLDEDGLRNLSGTQWFYNSRFSYFYMERIIDYFYSISPNPKEFGIEARDMFDVGDEVEIVAPLGASVEMICNDAGNREEFITYQWFKDGLSKFGKKNKTYTISSVRASDYGHYTTRITNDYVKSYDANSNYGEVFTKGYYLVAEPVPPTIEKAVVANNGQYIDLYFSKRMAEGGYEHLQIQANGRNIAVSAAEVRGRLDKEVRISLAAPILKDEMVTISFAADGLKDKNGGELQAISDLAVENRTRIAPVIVEAKTTLDGTGIVLEFDQFIDKTSLPATQFEIQGEAPYTVSLVSLLRGEVDQDISKMVLLSLDREIEDSTEVITAQYLSGKLAGLYAGTVQPTDPVAVRNQVTVDKTAIRFRFEDGSELLDDVLIQGSWKVGPIQLFDDGTNGDEMADDHIWTYQTSLVDDDYSWDVISRKTVNAIDTVESTDPETGNRVLILNPVTLNVDSIISENILLAFSVLGETITGDSIYGIFNRDVIFNLKIGETTEAVYLMGINNDWNEGQLMTLADKNKYSFTLPKLTAGDVIKYNYRVGTDWENETPEPRTYIVKNGDNIINDEFGIFTSVTGIETPSLKIFPNPSADGLIRVEGIERFERLDILNSLGQPIHQRSLNKQHSINLDLSNQIKGFYYLVGITRSGKKYAYKILLQ